MSFKHYATSGVTVVWEEGDRELSITELTVELAALSLKQDFVVWRRVPGQPTHLRRR